MQKKNLTGLFFGSFNPIHIGHLIIASYILENTDMEELWFVISPQNPFKVKKSMLAENHRLALVNEAIDDYPGLKACDIEFALPKPSYTIHTLEALAEKYPEREFALIMGLDNLQHFHKWRNAELIINNHKLFVYPRPGANGGQFESHPSVHIVNAPLIELSSSYIRQAIAEKKEVRFMLHPKVWKYVDEMNFYKA